MLLTKLVQHVGGVEPAVVAQLARDNLERTGERVDEQLAFAGDPARVVAEVAGEFHVDGAAAGDDGGVLDRSADNLDRVVERPGSLLDELLGASSQHQRARLAPGAPAEEVEPLVANLLLLENLARAHLVGGEVIHRGLDPGSGGLGHAQEILLGDAAGAEDPAVGKVLRREVTDRESRQDNLSAALDALGQFVVNDVPLRIDNLLVLGGIRQANLGVVLLALELQFQVQRQYFGVVEVLRLLLEAGVGKRLLERDAVDEERFTHGPCG